MLQNFFSRLRAAHGFTLIELLVVITILGILTAGAVTSFGSSRQSARDSTRQAHLKDLQSSIESFYNSNQGYPVDNSADNLADLLKNDYLNSQWPKDSKSGTSGYGYVYCTAGVNNVPNQVYALAARMEDDGFSTAARLNADVADTGYRVYIRGNRSLLESPTDAETAPACSSATLIAPLTGTPTGGVIVDPTA